MKQYSNNGNYDGGVLMWIHVVPNAVIFCATCGASHPVGDAEMFIDAHAVLRGTLNYVCDCSAAFSLADFLHGGAVLCRQISFSKPVVYEAASC